MNYYNEFDRNAAEWIRQLIADGLIPPGHVDERSITEVTPDDLKGFTQCHFFCGIAGWPHALQLAGWPATRPIWTASLPCQPFSVAGQGKGGEDERHLWPVFERLVRECRPECIVGEQVEAAVRHGWIDRVCTDLEAEDYAFGFVVLGAHSVGAPHIRQRLYWVAQSERGRISGRDQRGPGEARKQVGQPEDRKGFTDEPCDRREDADSIMAGSASRGLRIDGSASGIAGYLDERGTTDGVADSERRRREQCDEGQRGISVVDQGGRMGDAESSGLVGDSRRRSGDIAQDAIWTGEPIQQGLEGQPGYGDDRHEPGRIGTHAAGSVAEAGANFWSDSDPIQCSDGKQRRTQRSIRPLVAGLPRGVVHSSDQGVTPAEANATSEARVMRLKGYGNSICAPLAAEFIRAVMEVL